MSRPAKGDHYPMRLTFENAQAARVVREQISRITNVNPLPDKVMKRLYVRVDDDANSIRLFMAAQARAIGE
jgi:hypothetical protein